MPYQYWRFVSLSSLLGNFGPAELYFRQVPFGTHETGTYTPSSTFSGTMADLRDGSRTSGWISTNPGTHHITLDAGSAIDVTQVEIVTRTDRNDLNPTAWEIRASTDNFASSNVLIASGTRSQSLYVVGMPYLHHTPGAAWEAVADTAYSDWKLEMFTESDNLNVAELRMRESTGGVDVLAGSTVTVSAESFGTTKALMFDANNATVWAASSPNRGAHWVRGAFAAPVTIRELLYRTRQVGDYSATATPFLYRLLASSDGGTTWRQRWELTRASTDYAAGTNYTYTVDSSIPSLSYRRRFAGLIG